MTVVMMSAVRTLECRY